MKQEDEVVKKRENWGIGTKIIVGIAWPLFFVKTTQTAWLQDNQEKHLLRGSFATVERVDKD